MIPSGRQSPAIPQEVADRPSAHRQPVVEPRVTAVPVPPRAKEQPPAPAKPMSWAGLVKAQSPTAAPSDTGPSGSHPVRFPIPPAMPCMYAHEPDCVPCVAVSAAAHGVRSVEPPVPPPQPVREAPSARPPAPKPVEEQWQEVPVKKGKKKPANQAMPAGKTGGASRR